MMQKALVLLATLASVSAFSCGNPKYSSTGYSTTDAFFHFQTTFVVDLSLQCDTPIKNSPLYAVINDKTYQVAQSEETSQFQITWKLDHEQSGPQTFNIHIYDEDKYAELQRSAQTSPSFTVEYYHAGSSKARYGWLQHFVYLAAAASVYYAINLKSTLKP